MADLSGSPTLSIGFYVFKLPFYELLQTGLLVLTVGTLFLVSVVYAYFQMSQISQKFSAPSRELLSHISVLLCILVADLGVGFFLAHFGLVYSTMGVVYGAGFTATHVTEYALWSFGPACGSSSSALPVTSWPIGSWW
jgi:uncharacterized membrane protein (UPF0182 family)